MGILDNYEAADEAFRTGKVLSQGNDDLLTYLHGLSNLRNENQAVQHRDIIRGITINHILLQRHIDGLNKQNSRTQKLVIALTAAALLSGIPQIWFAYRADKRAETEQKTIAAPQPPQENKSVGPSQVLPPSSDQATKKKPAS